MAAFFGLLVYWLKIFFAAPFKDLEILWILIPIWVALIFTDFYQEKRGTSFGNAVTNGAIMLWVAVDWIRFLIRNYESFSGAFLAKIFLCVFVTAMGFFIIYEGVKAKQFIKLVGRVRETSYFMLVISPVIYGVLEPSWKFIIAIIVFFPLFYGIFELIDRLVPTPATYEEGGLGGGELKGSDKELGDLKF